jgi:hypothetical protein
MKAHLRHSRRSLAGVQVFTGPGPPVRSTRGGGLGGLSISPRNSQQPGFKVMMLMESLNIAISIFGFPPSALAGKAKTRGYRFPEARRDAQGRLAGNGYLRMNCSGELQERFIQAVSRRTG